MSYTDFTAWLKRLTNFQKEHTTMTIMTALMTRETQRILALRAALEALLCIECHYRIGFKGRHGSLGTGMPGYEYKDWSTCPTCAFARELLADDEQIVVDGIEARLNSTPTEQGQCDACGAIVDEEELQSGFPAAGVEGTFCAKCRGENK